ncbi:MAG: hypothetical protein NWE94_03310 [Candidatus Bathyarchaeota archaeon]|nr:hypothetical protein [Candidatus Bathyarchaeota archaeon]
MKKTSKIAVFTMLTLGISLTAASAVYVSSFLAILGVAIIFWGAILLYITPTKQVPLTLLTASATANSGNIERILAEHSLTHKGIYLPPKNLTDIELSLTFIPKKPNTPLPIREGTLDEKLTSPTTSGVFLTPPGLALSKLFEQELGVSFTKTNLKYLQEKMPSLLVENMGLAENVDIQTQSDTITVEIANSLFSSVCQETRKLPLTHNAVGCLLPSAIACAFAKATGKPIVIDDERQGTDDNTTTIEYRVLEE